MVLVERTSWKTRMLEWPYFHLSVLRKPDHSHYTFFHFQRKTVRSSIFPMYTQNTLGRKLRTINLFSYLRCISVKIYNLIKIRIEYILKYFLPELMARNIKIDATTAFLIFDLD